jgi:hypothetical protein
MGVGWDDRDRRGPQGGLTFGVLLIVVGGLFLAGQVWDIDWGRYGWPAFVIVPGLIMLVLGLAIPHESGLGLAIPGGIVATVGLILAFQDSTNTYASWAYAWALVAPGSVGASIFLFGLLHRRLDLVDAGLRTASVGLALFVCFGLFFEVVIGLADGGQRNVMRDALPFLAIAMGAIIVLINVLPRPRSQGAEPVTSDSWHDDNPSAPVPPSQS